MPRVRIVHWKASEAGPLIEVCRAGGFDVEFSDIPSPELAREIRHNQPDAVVIDLTRTPSHGREMALALRRTKYSRHIPIVFVGGEAEKVAGVRTFLPDAVYTTMGRLCVRLQSVCAKRPAMPAAPPSITERYGHRTKAQKLGIRAGSTVAVMDAPRDYAAGLGELPEDVTILEDPDEAQPVTLWYVRDAETYRDALQRMRRLAPKTKLWILWPKGAKSALNQYAVRELALGIGLVDYKICAIDDRWSAMVFAPRRTATGK